jgi:hypothetical protein
MEGDERTVLSAQFLVFESRRFELVQKGRKGRTILTMADRRAGKGIPHVGKQPRARRQDGAWRKKRSDAGKPRTRAGRQAASR